MKYGVRLISIGVFILHWTAQTHAAPPAGPADRDSPLYSSYFKEKRPLQLDVSTIAVFQPDSTRQPDTVRALIQRGCPADSVHPHPVPGWSTAATPPDMRTAAGIRRLTSMLAGDEAIEFTTPVLQDAKGGPVIPTAHLFVAFNEGVPAAQAEAVLTASGAGAIVDRNYAQLNGVYRLRSTVRSGLEVLAAANALAERGDVKFAEVDMIVTGHKSLIPTDDLFGSQWALHNTGQTVGCTGFESIQGMTDFDLDAPEAWEITMGDPAVIVAVLDDGIEQGHPDINQIPGTDTTYQALFNPFGGAYVDDDNHGTSVAGCISARFNGIGIVGVAPACKVVSVRCLVSLFGDQFSTTSSTIANALSWAQAHGARVTNSSWMLDFQSSLVAQAYSGTHAAGLVHFASSGNDVSGVQYPASLSSVNAVGGVDPDGEHTSFAASGPELDFAGPASMVRTTDRTGAHGYIFGDYGCVSGTSYASPYVAGVAALMLSVNPALTAGQLEHFLKASCTDLGPLGPDSAFGFGLPNALQAIKEVLPGPDPDPADLNGDGAVNSLDLAILLSSWSIPASAPGCAGKSPCPADINHDGFVNSIDLASLLSNWTL